VAEEVFISACLLSALTLVVEDDELVAFALILFDEALALALPLKLALLLMLTFFLALLMPLAVALAAALPLALTVALELATPLAVVVAVLLATVVAWPVVVLTALLMELTDALPFAEELPDTFAPLLFALASVLLAIPVFPLIADDPL